MTGKDELVCCMLEGVGLVIGKLRYDGNNYSGTLKIPRALQTQTDENKQAQLRLGEMIGYPNEIFLARPAVFIYEVRDEKIRNLYNETTKSPTNDNLIKLVTP
jgi:hypothetical protein